MPVINKERTACRQEAVMLMSGQYCRDAEASIGDRFYENQLQIKFLKEHCRFLQSSLDAEMNNRCCGNCDNWNLSNGYCNIVFDSHGKLSLRLQCSAACDHWLSCRG